MYEYMWGMTAAQVELMVYDVPIVVYGKNGDKFGKVNKKKMELVNEQWNEKYSDKEKIVNLDFMSQFINTNTK